ncbi:OmpA family protein [Moraxella marmotae]|uniref:OmpA family protein n=1 Tax=Moraxella marmotae TaxID=3344520 RepID=UPI0035F24E11
MKFKLLTLAAVTAATMTGCATTKQVAHDGVDAVEYSKFGQIFKSDKADDDIKFPEIKRSTFSPRGQTQGSWPNWSNIAQIEHGMSKDQIYNLIERPHFTEGLYNVHEWDYVFNYREGNDIKQCQYKLTFDKHYHVKGMYWKDPECADHLVQATAPQTPPPVIQNIYNTVQQENAKLLDTIVLEADALFAFDKASINDMLPGGREKLNQVAEMLKQLESDGRVVAYIVGHTDRFGDDAYNLTLSQQRASTVLGYLLSRGVKPISLNAVGAGEMMPVKFCTDGTRAQQIACLQPNRRVEIMIYKLN